MITIDADFSFEGFEKEVTEKLKLFPIGTDEVNEIGNIVVDDIREGIDEGIDLNNIAFTANTPQWVKRKQNNTVMLGKTGRLYASFKKQLFGIINADKNNGAVLEISAKGNGLFWQINPKRVLYKREFFGISERAVKKINDFLRSKFG